MSGEIGEFRVIAVGRRLLYGKWKTMPDFLTYYLPTSFGASWWNAELSKTAERQHPIIGWFRALEEVQRRHHVAEGGLFATPYYGACGAVLSLAYDTYTVEHHVDSPQAERSLGLLLARMQKADQFFGARHEIRVAALLLRAGFQLTWEDEVGRGPMRHGEFVATYPETMRAFWVECRMRQPDSEGSTFKFTRLLRDALLKPTALERLVFVEVSTPENSAASENGGWAYSAIKQLRNLENQPDSELLPSAEIIISNYPEHHRLSEVSSTELLMESFKSNRYRMGVAEDLWSVIKRREEDPELNALWRSIQENQFIPTTFDGTLAFVDESNRLVIGRRYEVDEGVVGVLEEAVVVEQKKQASGVLRLNDGRRVIVNFALTDHELTAWRQHPDTFFGVLRKHHPPIKDALELYDFFHLTYQDASKQKLLEQMSTHFDASELQDKSQQELAMLRAYRATIAALQANESFSPPAWQRRLKPPIDRAADD